MSRKKKANVTPEDVGKPYTDGEHIFKLIRCDKEPMATMKDLERPESEEEDYIITKPISGFTSFVRYNPEHEITKEKPPRADRGGTHRKRKSGEIDLEKIITQVAHDEELPKVTYGEIVYVGDTLRAAVFDLFVYLGKTSIPEIIEYIKAQPDSPNKTVLLNIFE